MWWGTLSASLYCLGGKRRLGDIPWNLSKNNKIAYGFPFPRPMHNIFNHLLVGLCLGDLLFLVCNLLVVPIALGRDDPVLDLLHLLAECGCHISLTISIFLTISITVERFQVTDVLHSMSLL